MTRSCLLFPHSTQSSTTVKEIIWTLSLTCSVPTKTAIAYNCAGEESGNSSMSLNILVSQGSHMHVQETQTQLQVVAARSCHSWGWRGGKFWIHSSAGTNQHRYTKSVQIHWFIICEDQVLFPHYLCSLSAFSPQLLPRRTYLFFLSWRTWAAK